MIRTYRGLITSPQFAAPATGPTLPHGPTFKQSMAAIAAPGREYNEQLWSMGQVLNAGGAMAWGMLGGK